MLQNPNPNDDNTMDINNVRRWNLGAEFSDKGKIIVYDAKWTASKSDRPQHRRTRVDKIIHEITNTLNSMKSKRNLEFLENWIFENFVLVGCHDNEPKRRRWDIFRELQQHVTSRERWISWRIGDEPWIRHCDLKSKWASMELNYSLSYGAWKFKSQSFAGEVMFTVRTRVHGIDAKRHYNSFRKPLWHSSET